ncbi:MAG: hypothetical protein KDA60_19170, partial [Planctomycetales bacterium]|nr:hypothetical protein [Planctomycetales bacterium]
MRRWKYLVPRMLLLAAFVLFLLAAFEPIVHWSVERSGESLLGQRFEIGQVTTSLREAELLLADITVADPANPKQILFTAEQLHLQFDGPALRRQRVIVKHGQLDGFQIGVGADLTGDASTAARGEPDPLNRSARWFDMIADQLAPIDQAQLPSTILLSRLVSGWQAERDRLESQATGVNERVQRLRLYLEEAGDNPLRNLESYQEAIANLETLRNDLHEVHAQANRLGQQLAMDKESLGVAVARDRAVADERYGEVPTLDPAALDEFLMMPELSRQIDTLMRWVAWGRGAIPVPSVNSRILGSSGRNVVFRGVTPEPRMLVETLVINGQGEFAGQRMSLQGVAKNLTNDHELVGLPTEITVQAIDGPTMLVHAILQGQGDSRQDRYTIDCPSLRQPARILGDPGQLSVAVAPAESHVWARFDVRGPNVEGDLIFKQPKVQMSTSLRHVIDDPALAHLVANAASRVDRLVATVRVSGTIDEPALAVESNLGKDIAAAVDVVLQQEIERRRTAQLASVQDAVHQAWQQIELQLNDVQQSALALYEQGTADIERVTEYIAVRVQSP